MSEANKFVSEANIFVSEASKFSAGARIFRGPLGHEILVKYIALKSSYPHPYWKALGEMKKRTVVGRQQ